MPKVKELSFRFDRKTASGKTSVWEVVGTAGEDDVIGTIMWSGPWRKYIYVTREFCFLAPDCLREIADFCTRQTTALYDSKKHS